MTPLQCLNDFGAWSGRGYTDHIYLHLSVSGWSLNVRKVISDLFYSFLWKQIFQRHVHFCCLLHIYHLTPRRKMCVWYEVCVRCGHLSTSHSSFIKTSLYGTCCIHLFMEPGVQCRIQCGIHQLHCNILHAVCLYYEVYLVSTAMSCQMKHNTVRLCVCRTMFGWWRYGGTNIRTTSTPVVLKLSLLPTETSLSLNASGTIHTCFGCLVFCVTWSHFSTFSVSFYYQLLSKGPCTARTPTTVEVGHRVYFYSAFKKMSSIQR